MNAPELIMNLVVQTIAQSPIMKSISGNLYKWTRPKVKANSKMKEDILLTFIGGSNSQFQADIVKLTIFVPNINTVTNSKRFDEILQPIIALFDKKSFGNHRFEITETPNIFPIMDNSVDASFSTVFIRVTTINF